MTPATQQLPASEVLRLALEKLGPNGEFWIKGAWARDCHGADVSSREPSAVEFCSSSAIKAAGGNYFDDDRPWNFLSDAMGGDYFTFNDSPARTFPEVKAAFEKAIELAKAAEGGAR